MELGAYSGHPLTARCAAPPRFAAPLPLGRRGHTPLNLGLSTVNSAISTQLSCFHNLPHSSTTAQKSPLCFHNLTNSCPCNHFLLITFQNCRVPALSAVEGSPYARTTVRPRIRLTSFPSASYILPSTPAGFCAIMRPLIGPGEPVASSLVRRTDSRTRLRARLR